ncbi:MAG: tetraacyldisaccharide 4'-kinase [Candidatus Omnitrophota bacterium]
MISFRQYILSIMRDKRKGPLAFILKGVLYVLSFVYGAALKGIELAYKYGIRKKYKVDIPVISIGNITVGGTGKTPFAMFLADQLVSVGRKPGILIRGYGEDENVVLREELPETVVYVGQDRLKNAKTAISDGIDVLILDDGFQHRRLKKDLNIVLIDSISCFGNGFLLPRGILREPVVSLKRADIFVLTKTDRALPGQIEKIKKHLKPLILEKPVIYARHRPTFLTDVTGAAYSVDTVSGKRVCLVSGIGDPSYFAFLVNGLNADIVLKKEYTDHHSYGQRDIVDIYKDCLKFDVEMVLTTKKDFVKIRDLDISLIEEILFVLNVSMDISEGKESLIAGFNSVFCGKRA